MARDISHLAGDLTRRVQKIDRAIETGTRDIIRLAAQEAKEAQLDVLRRDAGGDLRLSRVRSGRGAAIGVRYDLRGQGSTSSAEVKATGPVPLLANPSKPHRIPRQRGGRRRVIAIPGVGVRAFANHPGTSGKDSWNKGRERAEPRLKTVIGRRTDEVLKRAFTSGG